MRSQLSGISEVSLWGGWEPWGLLERPLRGRGDGQSAAEALPIGLRLSSFQLQDDPEETQLKLLQIKLKTSYKQDRPAPAMHLPLRDPSTSDSRPSGGWG